MFLATTHSLKQLKSALWTYSLDCKFMSRPAKCHWKFHFEATYWMWSINRCSCNPGSASAHRTLCQSKDSCQPNRRSDTHLIKAFGIKAGLNSCPLQYCYFHWLVGSMDYSANLFGRAPPWMLKRLRIVSIRGCKFAVWRCTSWDLQNQLELFGTRSARCYLPHSTPSYWSTWVCFESDQAFHPSTSCHLHVSLKLWFQSSRAHSTSEAQANQLPKENLCE